MEFCTLLIGVIGLLLLLVFLKFAKLNAYLQSLGVPVDRGTPLLKQNFLFLDHDVKCLQKFGHVWARCDGVTPVLMVAEPELVKEITVKKFDKFPNHMEFGVVNEVHTIFCVCKKSFTFKLPNTMTYLPITNKNI